MKDRELRKTGIDIIGDIPWGTHACQFYETGEDLVDILVPYFKAGLENNEFCMWVTSDPLNVEDAKAALKKVVKNLDDFIKKGQIEILDYGDWYTKSGKFDANNVLQSWVKKENQALKRGYDGLRLSGNTFWLGKGDWRNFTDYEEKINKVIRKYRMIAICTYSFDKCGACEAIDVVSNHQFALIRRAGKWVIIESSERKRTEEALRESKELLEKTFTSQRDAIVILDAPPLPTPPTILACNPAATETFGYTHQEMLGRTTAFLHVNETTLRKFQEHLYPAIEERGFLHLPEFKMKRKDGTVFPTEHNVMPLEDERGKRIGWVSVVRDITERKRAEEALRASAERYRTLFEGSRDAVYITTREGKFVDINKAGLELLGYTKEELMRSLNVQETYANSNDRSRFQQEIEQKGFVRDYEIKLRKKDGTEIDCMVTAVLRRASNGSNLGYQGIIRDITEHKRTEEALRESEKKYRNLVESINDVVYAIDGSGVFTYISPVVKNTLGYEPDEVIGRQFLEFVYKEDHDLLMRRFSELREGIVGHSDYRVIGKQGDIKWVRTLTNPIIEEGGFVGARGVLIDITERKRAEKEREQLFKQVQASRERLRNLSRRLVDAQEVERRQLVRRLHDEVGQSLTALGINLNIVHNQLPPETATKTATRIDDSLKLVGEIVERIRDVMAELRPPVLDDYGVSAALRWYGKQFSERTGIANIVEGEELMPRLPLATETALFRITQEALTNVAKHAQAKQVIITLKSREEKVYPTIADDGIGFEQQQQWGLINMRERAQAVEGTLIIETSPGKGTKIVVEVPRNH